jgi:hypothetical protein
VDLTCELNARKEQKKGGIPSFVNSVGRNCWQSWAFLTSLASFANSLGPGCQQLRPMLLAKLAVGKAGLLCQQPCPADLPTASTDAVGKASCWQSCHSLCQPDFANSRRFPVGEGNDIQADGVPSSPTAHMAVGEAFPTGPAFLLAKRSFPSLKTPTVISQHELGNPVGKDFANRIGVFANSLALLAKHVFPVVIVVSRSSCV